MGICAVKCIVSEAKLYIDITCYCEVSVDRTLPKEEPLTDIEIWK
jgi:hypothetical protein